MAASTHKIEPITDLTGAEKGLPALVLGNSPWRAGFPIGAWAGITIGCNAIYREGVELDYLVAVDPAMVKEVAAWKPWEHGVKLVISQERNWRGNVPPGAGVYCVSAGFLWQRLAGNLALGLAMLLGCNPIVMAGFSMDGTNMFIGTKNYRHIQPGAGKRISGSDKKHNLAIRSRLEELNADNFDVYWVAPALEMLELLERPSAKNTGK